MRELCAPNGPSVTSVCGLCILGAANGVLQATTNHGPKRLKTALCLVHGRRPTLGYHIRHVPDSLSHGPAVNARTWRREMTLLLLLHV